MSTHLVSSESYVFRPAKTAQPPWQRLLAVVREWQRRIESRRELAALSDLELRDLGYPADAAAEKHKPFWRK